MLLHSVANNAFTTVAAAVAAIDTDIVVDTSTLDDLTVPFYVDIGSELMEVTVVSADDPIAGQSTWTVTRAVAGAAAAYAVDAPVVQRVYSQQMDEMHTGLYLIQKALEMLTGAQDGIITPPTKLSLKVVPSALLVVSVSAGAGVVSGALVGSPSAQLVTMTPPVAGTRTDLIQISNLNVVSLKTGSTTPDSNNIGLAEIAMASTDTVITSGMITDVRTFI